MLIVFTFFSLLKTVKVWKYKFILVVFALLIFLFFIFLFFSIFVLLILLGVKIKNDTKFKKSKS